jgi:hypothetical protein
MGGKPPYGLRAVGEKKDSRLIIDDIVDTESGYSEYDVMRLAWHLLVEKDWPTDRIAGYLTEAGIPTRDGKHAWSAQVVWKLLKSRTYVGQHTFRAKDGTVHTNPVPAIFTEEEWERAQGSLREHKRYNRTKRPDRDYLLRGLLFCATCGAPYAPTNTRVSTTVPDPYRSTMYPYYRCSTRLKHQRHTRQGWDATGGKTWPDCESIGVPAHAIEAAVWADIEHIARKPGPVLTVLAAQSGNRLGSAQTQRDTLARIQAELDAYQAQRDDAVALFTRKRINERDLDRQLDRIAREETGAREQHAKIMAALQETTTQQERLVSARTLLQQLHAILDEGPITPELQRKVTQAAVVRIDVKTVEAGVSQRGKPRYKAGFRITYVFGEDVLAQLRDTTSSTARR